MSEDAASAKLCDKRLLCLDTLHLEQREIEYNGVSVKSRKFPTLSSAENVASELVGN